MKRNISVSGARSSVSVFHGLDFDGPFRPANIIVECDPHGFENAGECFNYLVSKEYTPKTVEGEAVGNCRDLPEMNVWFVDQRAGGGSDSRRRA